MNEIQFTYHEPDISGLARPGKAPLKVIDYSATESGVLWTLQHPGGSEIEYKTSTKAVRGNPLGALLDALLYPLQDAPRLNPDWLVGLELVAEISWHRDDDGNVTQSARPCGVAENPRPYPWEDAREFAAVAASPKRFRHYQTQHVRG